MSTELRQLKQEVESWATNANHRGLLDNRALEQINGVGVATPASLFDEDERPLVVGLFGGTGVGKSTLLNRLADDQIARTSVERPTSREVTMYLHDTVKVNQLPDDFPVEKIRVSTHNREAHRHLLWIDMPDFDSVEEENRQLVQGWLPHIDLLVYVVSPERYKDDNGWRLLLSHGHRHAWVFVINHWDRGNELQRKDFENLLSTAGLDSPRIFCTDCSQQDRGALTEALAVDDQFGELESTIVSMADSNTIRQLEARGVTVRASEMQQVVQQTVATLGNPDNFNRLRDVWDLEWANESSAVHTSIQWRFPLMAQHYERHEPGLLKTLVQTIRGKNETVVEQSIPGNMEGRVFDEESILRIKDDIDAVPLLAMDHELPHKLIQQELEPLKSDLDRTLNRIAANSLKEALSNPGTRLQRMLHKMLGYLGALLPTLAMIWVGYRIVEGFHRGGADSGSYLGSNFAINGLLLIGLAWLVPWFLRRKTRPSLTDAALSGMHTGTDKALAYTRAEIRQALHRSNDILVETIGQGEGFLSQQINPHDRAESSSQLAGVLIDQAPRN